MKIELELLIEDAHFPLFPTSPLTSGGHWEKLLESFISDLNLDPNYSPGVIKFFVAFVKFEGGKPTYWL